MSKSKGRRLAEWLRNLDSNSKASSDTIADDSISTAKLQTDAVTNPKIADGAVHTANLADANVTFAKLHTALVVTESDAIGSNDNDTTIATSAAIKDYVDTQVAGKDALSELSGDSDDITEGSSNLYFTNERVDDRVNSLLTAGTGITLTYDDTANTLTVAGAAQYGDSDVASYLSTNGYGTSSSIIASITDSAPTTLDTLNELAAALGDDANFSTTVTNSIGTKWTQDNTKISNWDTAYSWGNHASAGYLTSFTETDPTVPSHVKSITTTEKSNWNTAYSWGNHASAGYLTSFDITTQTDTKYLRSDADDSVSNQITFPSAIGNRPILQGGFLSRLSSDGDADIWGISEDYYPSQGTASNAWGIRWASNPNEIQFVGANQNKLRIDLDTNGTVYIDNNEVWHAGNDGSGSGLDADLLDGQHGSYYQPASTAITTSSTQGNSIFIRNSSPTIYLRDTDNLPSMIHQNSNLFYVLRGASNDATSWSTHATGAANNAAGKWPLEINITNSGNYVRFASSALQAGGYTVWHTGNDGSGSGLDADTVDGIQGSNLLTLNGTHTQTGTLTFENTLSFSTAYNEPIVRHGSQGPYFRSDGTYIVWDKGSNTGSDSNFYINNFSNIRKDNNIVWHAGNDGSGSGLDADTVDGIQAASFLRSDVADTAVKLTFGTGNVQAPTSSDATTGARLILYPLGNGRDYSIGIEGNTMWFNSDDHYKWYVDGALKFEWDNSAGQFEISGNKVWHAGNDGSGSGLDADTLDGYTWGTAGKNVVAENFNVVSGSGKGLRFWDGSTNYQIVMAAQGTGGYGRYTYEPNSDYNMYFRMASGANRGFVFQNNTTNVANIDASGNIRADGVISSNNKQAMNCAHWSGSGTTTGAIKITLPGSYSGNWSMPVIEVTTYRYSGDAHVIYTISGHNWSNGVWYNAGVTAEGGTPLAVRLGHDGTKDCIIIGETNTSWSYGSVTVALKCHPSMYASNQNMTSGWGISQITSMPSGVTAKTVNKLWHTSNDGSGSGLDADLLDGQHGSYYLNYNNLSNKPTIPTNNNQLTNGAGYITGITSSNVTTALGYTPAHLDHFRHTGTGNYTSTTTSALLTEALGDDAFDSYLTAHKTSWSYAGNGNLTDAGRLTELAGTSWLWWTDNSGDNVQGNITALCIAPNTGGSAGKVFIYNNQGSGYSPGWREVWTSASDGSGSGLDADTLDGSHASSFMLSSGIPNNTDVYINARVIRNNNTSTYNDGMYIGYASSNSGPTRIYGGGSSTTHLYISGTSLTFNGSNVWHAGNDGSGSGLDADTVDGIQGSSIMRLDASGTVPDGVIHTYECYGNIATSSGNQASLQCFNSGSGTDAFMTFHVGGDYAANLGVDGGINDLAYGGWSAGAASYRVYHAGNTPSQTITVAGIGRNSHHTGHLVGSYNSVGANSYKSNPIYTIGSSYNPSDAALGNMYGIGYSHTNASFIGLGASGSWGMYVAADGDARIWLGGSTGQINASSNITAYASDGRLKTNITPIENAIDKVKKIRGVTFDWVDNITSEYDFHPASMHEHGVIAQEIQEVIPDAVVTAPFNGNYTRKNGLDHNFLTVDKDKIIPLLIEAIKEQQAQIEELKEIIKCQ